MEAPGSPRELKEHWEGAGLHWRGGFSGACQGPGLTSISDRGSEDARCGHPHWEVKGHKGHSVFSLGMKPLPSVCCRWATAAAARQEFGTYLLTILPENGMKGMPSAERAVSRHPENCNSTEGGPSIHNVRPIHNPTGSCPPSSHYRNRDPSLVTLVPSSTTCLGGSFRAMTLICNELMRDGSLSAPLKHRDGHCLQATGWRWTEGQGEAWWPPEPSAGPRTWVMAKSGGAHALLQSHGGHLID